MDQIISPAADAAWQAARAELMKRLSEQGAIDIGPWTRDELYHRPQQLGVTIRNRFKPSRPAT